MCYNSYCKNKNCVDYRAVERIKKIYCMEAIITIISVLVLCALFGGSIMDFIGKIIGFLLLGGIFGLVGGAICWLIASIIFSAGVMGFFIGFVVGVIIYLIKWF